MAVFDKKPEEPITAERIVTEDLINQQCNAIDRELAVLAKFNNSPQRTDESVMLAGHLSQLQKMLKIDLNQEYALIDYWRTKTQ